MKVFKGLRWCKKHQVQVRHAKMLQSILFFYKLQRRSHSWWKLHCVKQDVKGRTGHRRLLAGNCFSCWVRGKEIQNCWVSLTNGESSLPRVPCYIGSLSLTRYGRRKIMTTTVWEQDTRERMEETGKSRHPVLNLVCVGSQTPREYTYICIYKHIYI